MNKVNIAKDFSRYPAGRYRSDGPYSGQQFRDDYLLPILSKGKKLTIELDGTKGYGSSFLEEAFGGLVRNGLSAKEVLASIQLITKDLSLKLEIEQYINSGSSGTPNDKQ
ncbi:MAG: STAS-like domain-containing protein [Pseudomonadota bacterium]|nr:STAS-like domain-containing protein [Pseudomonadota bacterium]